MSPLSVPQSRSRHSPAPIDTVGCGVVAFVLDVELLLAADDVSEELARVVVELELGTDVSAPADVSRRIKLRKMPIQC